jgi:hypothetical protein
MKQIKILVIMVLLFGMSSCRKNLLDVAPTTLLNDAQIFSTSATMDAYFAALYADIPMEDYSFCNATFGGFPGNGFNYTANADDEAADYHQTNPMLSAGPEVYAQIYQAIRNVNNLIINLPAQAAYTDAQKKQWLGEALFIRAYCYQELVKVYGGVPILLTTQGQTPVPLPRNKEVEVWDQIKLDLDNSVASFNAAAVANPIYDVSKGANLVYGRANKWVSLALESRVMLHAGSIGKFEPGSIAAANLSATGGINGVDATHAQTYMQAAFDSGNAIIQSNVYQLYHKYAAFGTATLANTADYSKNFQYLFYDCKQGDSNTEAIFCRGYDYATSDNRTHSQDLMVLPDYIRSSTGYDNRLQPAGDLVQKFTDLDGTVGPFNANVLNTVFHYPTMHAPFDKKDPRFAGTIIAPGTEFRNSGPWNNVTNTGITAQKGVILNNVQYNSSDKNQFFSPSAKTFSKTKQADGIVGSGNSSNSDDSFWLKKWTDPVTDISLIHDYSSRTSYMDLRYGEVIMNTAEASFELGHAPSEALGLINQIRARAGMFPYTTIDENTIRNERFIELSFENRTFWDYIRWRTLNTRFFGTTPEFAIRIYWDIDTQDYVFIPVNRTTPNYNDRKYYYSDIPSAELPYFAKQPNGGHNPGY